MYNLIHYQSLYETILKFDTLVFHTSPQLCISPFTTIHDGNFRHHLSMYATIHDGNIRRIYYSYTRIPGSWYGLRPGSEEVK